MKTITFAIPCYNSEAYMDKCIESILAFDDGRGDIEILIVDDGSTKDNTAQKADSWHDRYPDTVFAIHKENGGHGSAVNAGLAAARGRYFKVVDSDDWLDEDSMIKIMSFLRKQSELKDAVDLVIANYVYEKVYEDKRTVIDYKNVFPVGEEFGWDDTKHFHQSQYLLMHSVIYRTELLQDLGLKLPEHTFYVDNIFVFKPLPSVRTMYYLDVDMYRYFIGRDDQSVNEKNMIKRVDQQLRVTRIMMNAVDVYALPPEQAKLRAYMLNYFSMMMAISSIFLTLDGSKEALAKRRQLWDDLKAHDGHLYRRCRFSVAEGCNLPGWLGSKISIGGYRIAQKIFKFN